MGRRTASREAKESPLSPPHMAWLASTKTVTAVQAGRVALPRQDGPGPGLFRPTVLVRRSPVAEGQAVLIAETSNSRVTLSLTRTPPVSSAAFQVMP
jgi:hypothetical protein